MQHNKQNQPINRQMTPSKGRKYAYSESISACQIPTTSSTVHTEHHNDQHLYIKKLQQELAQQRLKSKKIEQQTIREQTKVLEQIDILENKFIQVQNEKQQMKQLLEESMIEIQQYKKVKGIAKAMVDMMAKVQGKNGDFHEAWRWVKKVVWEYQAIRKKGLEWKQAYDKLKKQQKKRNDTFSNQSDVSSESLQKQ